MLRLNIDPSSEEDSPPPELPPKRHCLASLNLKAPSNFRVFSWNCDDIRPYLPIPKVSNSIDSYFARVSPPQKQNTTASSLWKIRSILKQRKWPEFLCLQEVKIQVTDKPLLARAKAAATSEDDDGPAYTMYSTLPVTAKRALQNRAMYGVITYVRNDIAEQITVVRGVDWDDEGRVLILELGGLVLINLYAVNGTDAPYIIRSTGQATGETRHERKRQFNALLKEECLRIKERGFEICIVGDVNISRASIDIFPRLRTGVPHVLARKQFNEEFLPETGLVDAWRERHGEDAKGYTWYMRGVREGMDCARVDMILVTRGLYNCAKEIEIEKWGGSQCGSDHTLVWIEIDGFNN